MEKDEYYNKNKDKIKLNDISTWKYYPLGNPMRKTYDYNNIPLNIFLLRYYEKYDDTNWNRWINTIVKPLFKDDYESWKRIDFKYYSIQDEKKFNSWFKERHNKMKESYYDLKQHCDADDEIVLFISYLSGMNFFSDINLSINEWLNRKHYDLGGRYKTKPDIYSLKEMSKYIYGENLVKDKLITLKWHNQ